MGCNVILFFFQPLLCEDKYYGSHNTDLINHLTLRIMQLLVDIISAVLYNNACAELRRSRYARY